MGQYNYMFTKSHIKGDCLFYSKGRNYIANIVAMGDLVGKMKRNFL
jgi:hypothetical protein